MSSHFFSKDWKWAENEESSSKIDNKIIITTSRSATFIDIFTPLEWAKESSFEFYKCDDEFIDISPTTPRLCSCIYIYSLHKGLDWSARSVRCVEMKFRNSRNIKHNRSLHHIERYLNTQPSIYLLHVILSDFIIIIVSHSSSLSRFELNNRWIVERVSEFGVLSVEVLSKFNTLMNMEIIKTKHTQWVYFVHFQMLNRRHHQNHHPSNEAKRILLLPLLL